MADNTLPKIIGPLFALATSMIDGLAAHETAIGVKQNTQAALSPDFMAAQLAQAAFLAAQSAQPPLSTQVRNVDNAARTFISHSADVLGLFLGRSYSQAWDATGFPNDSTAVPPTIEERQALLQALSGYFSNHPDQENAGFGVSSAQAQSLFDDLSQARAAVNEQLAAKGAKKVTRDAAEKVLRRRMRGLIDELGQLLPDDSPLWYAFGLNPPAAPSTPEAPSSLVAQQGGEAGSLQIDWADTPRAARYRVWKQIVGVDPAYVAAATVYDSDTVLSGLPSGATVNIQVTAVNDAGESVPSVPVQAVIS